MRARWQWPHRIPARLRRAKHASQPPRALPAQRAEALERSGGRVASERLVAELYPEAIALSRALADNTLVQDIDVSSPLCVDQGGRVLVEAIAAANAARRLRLCFKTLSGPAVSSLAVFLAPGERINVCKLERERLLFIGTQFSILYTFMYSPA